MYRKLIYLISLILLLGITSDALAYGKDGDPLIWVGDYNGLGSGDQDWTDAENWAIPDGNFIDAPEDWARPPAAPTLKEGAWMRYCYAPGCPIIDLSMNAEAWFVCVGIGDSKEGIEADAELTMTGGKLTTPDDTVNWLGLALDYNDVGVLNMQEGSIITHDFYVGFLGNATCNMTGGTIDAYDGRFEICRTAGLSGENEGASGHVNLDGGSIECADFFMRGFGRDTLEADDDVTATMDVNEGIMILNDGDHTSPDSLLSYFIDQGWITGYNNSPRSAIHLDYDAEKDATTLSAVLYDNGAAWVPVPGSRSVDVNFAGLTLGWNSGDYTQPVAGHQLYIGTDYDIVKNATTSTGGIYIGALDSNTYPVPGELGLGKTYYWRVDEVNDTGPNTWKGDVWIFTTENIIIEDMESHTVGGGDFIGWTWPDGKTMGNGTGSTVRLELADVNGGTGIVHDLDQSMKLNYNNSASPYYSEVSGTIGGSLGTPDYQIPGKADWTAGGAKAVVLYFRARDTDNANETLYMALEDGSGNIGVVECGEDDVLLHKDNIKCGSDLLVEYNKDRMCLRSDPNMKYDVGWQEWPIELQEFVDANSNLDLTDVAEVYLGFGDRVNPVSGGSGSVYIDDIKLYPPKCIYVTGEGLDADFNEDCIVDFKDYAMLANSWLEETRLWE